MKFLVTLILLNISVVYAQDYNCKRVFFKEKKSSKESSVFSNENNKIVKTRYCSIYSNGNRTLSISFKKGSQGIKLQFLSLVLQSGGLGLKNEIVLGQNIKIALIFEDGTNEIIQFNSSEQENMFNSGGNKGNENQIDLSKRLLDKLMNARVVKLEIQNPFNRINESKVKSEEVKAKIQEKVIQYANCFNLII